jgi:hypothetical protein
MIVDQNRTIRNASTQYHTAAQLHYKTIYEPYIINALRLLLPMSGQVRPKLID